VDRDIVVVGASAGGVEALIRLVEGLSPEIRSAIFVVLHIPADSTSMLPQILSRAGPLPAVTATDRAPIEYGTIYVAPPDHHLLIEDGHMRLTFGPRENGHRPAVDPLFRTAAVAYGPRVVGVILSGTLGDGTDGMEFVKEHGGVTVVQKPADALFPGMPEMVLERVDVDYSLPATRIGELLMELDGGPEGEKRPPPSRAENEPSNDIALQDIGEGKGPPSTFTCPECHGTLFEVTNGEFTHYTCRVGHAYSAAGLELAKDRELEDALWSALRALEERRDLSRRLRERASRGGRKGAEAAFARQERDAIERAAIIRRAVLAPRQSEDTAPSESAE